MSGLPSLSRAVGFSVLVYDVKLILELDDRKTFSKFSPEIVTGVYGYIGPVVNVTRFAIDSYFEKIHVSVRPA